MALRYKYLVLRLTDKIDLKYMVEWVAASAHRAQWLVIAKFEDIGVLPYDCYSKLYSRLVLSIIDYGACVWGFKEFDCIKDVQHRAISFFLGVHKKLVNTTILGEMGWTTSRFSKSYMWVEACVDIVIWKKTD